MTAGGDNERELGGDDLVAAEYVLGVLPAEERVAAARRIELDADFARLVDQWEFRFSPMAESYAPAEPPAGVRAAIERRLFSDPPASSAARPSFWQSLALWRGVAAAAIAAAAIAIAVPLVEPGDRGAVPGEVRLVASLAHDDTDVRYMALYDRRSGEVDLSHVSGARAAGHDFELWLIEGDNAPVSLGVIPTGAAVAVPITEDERDRIARGAVFAISLEPAGGSPTGAPTGPVVAAGDLKAI